MDKTPDNALAHSIWKVQHEFLGSFCEEDALSIWITYLHDRSSYCISLSKKFGYLAKEDRREEVVYICIEEI